MQVFVLGLEGYRSIYFQFGGHLSTYPYNGSPKKGGGVWKISLSVPLLYRILNHKRGRIPFVSYVTVYDACYFQHR